MQKRTVVLWVKTKDQLCATVVIFRDRICQTGNTYRLEKACDVLTQLHSFTIMLTIYTTYLHMS